MPRLLRLWLGFLLFRSALGLLVSLSATFVTHSVANADPMPIPGPATRAIELSYSVQIPLVNVGAGPVDIFVPIAQSDEQQQVTILGVDSNVSGAIHVEQKFGNKFWHGHLDQATGEQISVRVNYQILRSVLLASSLHQAPSGESLSQLPSDIARYVQPDRLVPTSGALIDKMRKDIKITPSDSAINKLRAIYDFVIDTMEYKKVGTGWGNGSTYWACSQKYGNCTDFHALFISLARSYGIPTRFEIGFPIPLDRTEGKIDGYHCWASVYLPSIGWLPIDASEAKKHPEYRELFFGNQPADRVRFTIGRDIVLGDGQRDSDLNFFIYPYVEVGGKNLGRVPAEVSYHDVRNNVLLVSGQSGEKKAAPDKL